MHDHDQARVARTEALFREVNERIREISAYDHDAEFLCECGDESCTRPITMTLAEYEQLRSEPTHFAVVPGHVADDVEHVVSRHDESYWVVEKTSGEPAALAAGLDPRS